MESANQVVVVTLVIAAFVALCGFSGTLPDRLTPSAEPLHAATYEQHFPDTAEVLARAMPQRAQPAALTASR